MRSTCSFVGFRITVPEAESAPEARLAFTVRPLAPGDHKTVFNFAGLDSDDASMLDARLRLLRSGLGTAYVGETADGGLCYLGWTIAGSTELDETRTFFGETFAVLAPTEALVEGSWVPPRYRGYGVMAPAMRKMLDVSLPAGLDTAITFVEDINIASSKGVMRAGFVPFTIRTDTWRNFRCTATWREISANDYDPWSDHVSAATVA